MAVIDPWPEIDRLRAELASSLARNTEIAAELAALKAQQPVGYMFQHEDTGQTMCVDVQQVEWGFEKNNPRLINCGPLYARPVPAAPEAPATCKESLTVAPAAEFVAAVDRCYRMLLSEPDTKGALFKAENILREALADARTATAEQPDDALDAQQVACPGCAAKQSKIDALMLEYCPNEMTIEQIAEWAASQNPATDIDENAVTASALGYKFPACLCCGNHDSPRCVTCEIERDDPAEQSAAAMAKGGAQ